jgi:hypothetical protein
MIHRPFIAVQALAKTEAALLRLKLKDQASKHQNGFTALSKQLRRHARHAETAAVTGVSGDDGWCDDVANMYRDFAKLLTRTDPADWEESPEEAVKTTLSRLSELVKGLAVDATKALESGHEVMQKVVDSMTTLFGIYLAFLAVVFQGVTTAADRKCNQVWAPVVLYGFGALFITYTLFSSLKSGRQAYAKFTKSLALINAFPEMLSGNADVSRANDLREHSVVCKVFEPTSKVEASMYLCIAVLHVVVVAAAVQLYCS